MALVEKMRPQAAPAPAPEEGSGKAPLSARETLDSDIGFGLAASLLYSEGGSKSVLEAVKGQDPAVALGMFLSQMAMKLQQKTAEQGIELSPNIWLAEGGVTDRVLDEVEEMAEKAGVEMPEGIREQSVNEMMNVLKAASQSQPAGQEGGQPMGGQAPMGGGMAPPPMPQQGGF